MATDFLGQCLQFGRQDGIAVPGHQLLKGLSPVHFFAAQVLVVHIFGAFRTQANLSDRIFSNVAVRTHQLIHAAVRARGQHIVFQQDGLSLRRPQHGHRHVTVSKIGTGFPRGGLYVLGTVERIRIHRHQGGEAVSAVNVQGLAYRAETVGGIKVSAVLLVEIQPPVVPVGLPKRIQVVVVSPLGVNNLAKNAGLGHRERGHLEKVVAAVFQNHTVPSRALRGVHQVPAGLKGFGRRDFDGHVFAVLHRIKGHRNMVDPVGADIDQIHGRVFAQGLVGLLVTAIDLGFQPLALQVFQALLRTGFLHVADGGHVAAGNESEPLHGIAAAHPETYHTDTDIGNGVSGKLKHVRLTGLARRNRQFDDG